MSVTFPRSGAALATLTPLWIAVLLGLLLGCDLPAQSFTEIPTSLPGVRSGAVAWGDYDNDGDLDLLLIGSDGNNSLARIYRNNGGSFTDLNAGLPGVSAGAAAWGDYNGDGWLDFAITGDSSSGPLSRIYRNNGNGTFTDINAGLPGLGSSTLAWGDFDNDGDLDLFLTGYTGSAYLGKILRNNGNDSFTDSGITTIPGGAAGSAAWADFDKDGDLDLACSAFTSDTSSGQSSRLFRNNNGVFTNITSVSLTAMSYASVAWADYDNDNDLDLLMAGSSISGGQSFPSLRLYRNNTNGASFTSISSGMSGAQHCSLAWGDYDNDGDLDVAIAGYHTNFTPMARLYMNLGSGFFFNTGIGFTPVYEAALAWGDYDSDGDLDLVLAGFDGVNPVTRLYRNDNFFGNSPPAPPWGLNAIVSGKTVTLNWNAGFDADQTGGLSYNLRVGTAPGANDIMAAMASTATGLRRAPRLGNVNQRLSWPLKLPVGSYYWSAQTIDHNFAGSAFDTEQYFEIPVQAPDVATLTATNIGVTSATLRATANPNGDTTSFYFEYGMTTNYGSATAPLNLGNGVSDVSVTVLLTNILPATTYQFRAVAVNILGTSYGTNRSFTTPSFVEVTNAVFVGVGNGAIAWGDYNNDGFLDVLYGGGNSTGTVTRVYRNLGGTNFIEAVTNLAGLSYGTVVWGDYDNDGDLDVLLTGASPSRIYRNDGNEVFTDINANLPGLGTGASAVWADMDNDGDLDFAVAGAGSTLAYLYRNDGNDQFVSVTNSLLRMSESALAWADYDNDGDNDLLTAGYNFGAGSLGEVTRLYRNDGRGGLTNSALSFQGLYRSTASWGDYDNDGDLDLLACGSQFSTRYSLLYSNRNNGTFGTVTISAVPRVDQGNISWGDYDNDGDLDILVVGQASTGAVARVYRNDITVFRDSGTVLPTLGNVRAEWGDFDNDGRLDILQMGYTGSNYVTKLFRNVAPVANTPPAAPGGLTATITNNAVTLGWSATTDANQSGGLTYNVRVGTTPGGSEVLSGMASTATGFRRLPRMGNANLRQTTALTNLLVGTYYWSVQAVDHAYAGSAFSTNGSFTITAALLPPVALTKPATNLSLSSVTVEGIANARGAPTTTWFQYGTTTNLGNATAWQSVGSSTTNVFLSTTLSNLSDGTTYYFRLAGSNVNGTVFGTTLSFTTGFQFSNVVTALPTLGSGSYNWAGCTVWGDYDNDGDLDIALTGVNLPGTQVYRNDGGDGFTLVITNLPRAISGVIEWGDFDNDGWLDLLIGGAPELAVLRNNGDGAFSTNFISAINFYGPVHATWVDYDNDGDLDFAYVGENPTYPSARLFRNDAGTFVESDVPLPALYRGRTTWGDYDQDGDLDLALTGSMIITNFTVPSTRIYRNDGGGNFTDLQASLTGLTESSVVWADCDNDGDLDLLCAGHDGSAYRTILYRNDNGDFAEANCGLPTSHGVMAAADYDNDGDLDVSLKFFGSYYSTNVIYRNEADATFVPSGKFFLSDYQSYLSSVAWADFDQDGDLDALVGSRLLRNNELIPNLLAGAPGGLSTVRTGNVVMFTWNAPVDLNQPGGLSYNLQVGTTPGGVDVLSPASGGNGLRRLSQPGVASTPKWRLTLPVGTYYWRVQAIDHTLAGSPWSTESSFNVPVLPPGAVTAFAQTNAHGYPLMMGSVNPNGLATTVYFDFGETTNFGSRTPPQSVGGGTTWLPVSADLNTLLPERSYYYRFAASNSLGVSFGITRSVWQPWFTDRTPSYGYMSGASWADPDNDGDLDLSIQAYYGTYVYRNDDAVLTNKVTDWFGITYGGIAWGDYDNDGDLDAFVTGRDSNFARKAKLFRNDGNHAYTEVATPITPGANGTVNWADLDNDGDLDLIVTGENTQGGPFIQIALNDAGSFELKPTALPGLLYGMVACGDYDNDGDVDILLGGQGQSGGICKLFANDGQASFTDSGVVLPQLREVSLAFGDCDNDGDLDILINGRDDTATNCLAKVFRNHGGTFVDANASLPGIMGCSTWIDYDSDGRLDILIGGVSDTPGNMVMRIFRNVVGGAFADSALQPAPAASTQVGALPADYDNDGDQDVMFVFGRLLRNESRVTNSPPTAPTGLTNIVSANSVLLTWKPATDPNQSGGLSYNVRLGTTPGAGDVLSAMSLPDGRRLMPELGNAFTRTNLNLQNLKVGTYYWSVQSVDHAKAGSAFSTNGSFVIPAQVPSVVSLPYSNLTANGVTFVGRVTPNAATTSAFYEYGFTTNYGNQTTVTNLGSGTNPVTLTASVSDLNYVTTYHYRLVASNSFGITYGPDRAFATPQFSLVDLGLPPSGGAFGPGDDDNDGDLDFVMAVHSSSLTLLFQNNGSAAFATNGVTFPPLNGASFDWGDYDRDGDLDLLLAGWNSAGIYQNNGAAAFTNINAGLPAGWGTARWGDYDNDGDLDVLSSRIGSTQVYRNDGSGQFALASTPATFGGFAVWGDYDNDGDLDFVVCGVDASYNRATQLFRNDGPSGFVNSGIALLNLSGDAVWGDYDNDGDLDLLLNGSPGDFASGLTRLYRNNGDGTFAEISTALPDVSANLLWADYDNDGDLDVLMSGQINWPRHAAVYRNDGNGVFMDLGAGFIPVSGDGLACGDFDKDGDLDFLVSGYKDPNLEYIARLYRNNNASNPPPNAPTGLAAHRSGSVATLSWSPATDANQTGGLTYNLRVGTSPGGSDIVSPTAAPNGWQRVPRMGNVQQNLHWTLTNLTAGTYYWSVQAVDNSFAGSTFAPEAMFSTNSAPNKAPVANPQLIVIAEDTTRAITLTASDVEGQPLTYSLTASPTNGSLTGTLPHVSYRPNTNFFGADRILFKAHDGVTYSLPAMVSLIVTQITDVATTTVAITKSTNGQARLSLTGEPYERYRLEASDDLIHWVSLTNLVSSDGIMAAMDADVGVYDKRFYRAAWAPTPAKVGTATSLAGGGFQFAIGGELARHYEIQASTNLVDWSALTRILLTNSPATFADPQALDYSRRFYRVMPLP